MEHHILELNKENVIIARFWLRNIGFDVQISHLSYYIPVQYIYFQLCEFFKEIDRGVRVDRLRREVFEFARSDKGGLEITRNLPREGDGLNFRLVFRPLPDTPEERRRLARWLERVIRAPYM